jgi:hypothetical protein
MPTTTPSLAVTAEKIFTPNSYCVLALELAPPTCGDASVTSVPSGTPVPRSSAGYGGLDNDIADS